MRIKQMEPTRQMVWPILSLWRAAHLQRYTDRQRRHRMSWHRGGLERRGVHRGPRFFDGPRGLFQPDHARAFRSRARQRRTRASGCCARPGHSDHGGDKPRGNGLFSNSGALRLLGRRAICPVLVRGTGVARPSRSSRPAGLASSFSPRAPCHHRAALRVVRHAGALAIGAVWGSLTRATA